MSNRRSAAARGRAPSSVLPRRTAPSSAAVLAALGVASPAAANPAPTGGPPPGRAAGELPTVIVSADRLPRTPLELTATVTAVDADDIEFRFVADIRDLVRHEPGVVVKRAPARFGAAQGNTGRDGNSGFNIRGLDGNRVLIQVDGIRVPAAFSFGPSNFGRGAYVDVAGVRAVEILRGPASSLYGSDGVAGAVSFYTFDPADLLAADARGYASAAALYSGEDDGTAVSLRAAGRLGERHELLGLVTRREAGALENRGTNDAPNSTRTAPNPQDFRSTAALGKWVVRLGEDARVRTTVERVEERMTSDVLSARTPVPVAPTSVLRLDADDETERWRVAVDADIGLDGALADRVIVAAYLQDSQTRQFSAEDRLSSADRTRLNTYGERVHGLNLQAEREFATGPLRHRLVYGADAAWAFVSNLRDGTVPPPGERFPNKAFADTDYDLVGAFAQSEVALGDSGVFVTPGVRWDRFTLEPRADPAFPGVPVDLDGSRASPKLALRWRATATLSAYANWAQGFRAPTPGQVNNGFTNLFSPGFAYVSVGNPDLKPERSATLELGLRGENERFAWSLARFDARYRDFIEQVVVGGTGSASDPQRFQFVNLRTVDIDGVEARGTWTIAPEWRLQAAYARAEGAERGNGRPLNSVQPATLSAGVEWRPVAALRLGLDARHVREHDRADVDSGGLGAGQLQFVPPSNTVVDLTASWRPTARLEIGAAVRNLGDRRYWEWSDVQGQPVGSPVIDAYTQPGRTWSARARWTF